MARTLVGLDIGSSGLRAAELVPGRRRTTLRRFASVPLPEGVVRAGMVVDPDALSAALRELWSRGRFRTKAVAIGIANSGVLVRQMDLDWMPAPDFRKALRYQVADALPIPVDDANLDYHLLEELDAGADGASTADERRIARVLLVAAARDMVDGFVDAARAAGLRAVAVDIVPFALIRAATGAVPEPTTADAPTEAIVDVGADMVTVVVHQGGRPRYVRMIPGLGGDAVTRALQERYGWSWEEAERTKVVVGLPGHSTLTDEQGREGVDHPAQQVVAAESEALVAEIATTLDYVRGSQEAGLHRVLVTGAGSRLGGLRELLGRRLETPVEPLTLRDRVRSSRRLRLSEAEEQAVAIPAGLCMGGHA